MRSAKKSPRAGNPKIMLVHGNIQEILKIKSVSRDYILDKSQNLRYSVVSCLAVFVLRSILGPYWEKQASLGSARVFCAVWDICCHVGPFWVMKGLLALF